MRHVLPAIISTCCPALLAGVLTPTPTAAQDPILIVEKPADRRERAQLEARLRKIRVDLKLEDAGPKTLVDRLNLFVGDVTQFVVKPHDGDVDYASLKLDLKRTTMRNCLSLVQSMSDLRFVFKAGVIMVMHKDDVREVMTLRLYDVRVATFKIRDFPGPKIRIGIGEEEDQVEDEPETENTPSGLTLEKLEEVLRSQVVPESWGGESGASLSVSNGVLIVRQSERGHREVQKLLYQLGIGPNPNARFLRRARSVRRAKRPAVRRKSPAKPKKKADRKSTRRTTRR